MIYIALYLARMDSEVQRIYHSAEQTATNSGLLHGRLWQAERRGENILSAWHAHSPWVLVMPTCSIYYRKQKGRELRQSSKKRMKRAGWRSLKDQRVPRPAPTARQPTGGLYRKRWRRKRGRSSWTSTPGSTEIHRKNVSDKYDLFFWSDDKNCLFKSWKTWLK